MYYVEFLRVFRALRIFAVVMLVIVAIAGAIRIEAGTHWSNFFIEGMHFSPTAKKTVHVLPDGTQLSIVQDDAQGLRVEQRRSSGRLDVMIYEEPKAWKFHGQHVAAIRRAARHAVTSDSNDVSGVNIFESVLPNGMHVTHYVNDRHAKLDIFLIIAGFVAAIFASVIGGSLSKENDGHLELAWTKPASRQTFALTMFGIDALGILAAGALCVLTGWTIFAIFFGRHIPIGSSDTPGNLAMAILFPLAWYCLGQASSASMRRAGLILGMLWVAAFASIGLLAVNNNVLRAVLRAINTINPVAYYATENGHPATFNGASVNLLPATQLYDIAGLSAIIIIAIVASLMQWRRLEA